MSKDGKTLELNEARNLARRTVEGLRLKARRTRVTGSIRRRKKEVGDIDIVMEKKIGASRGTIETFFLEGVKVNIFHADAESFHALILATTGPKGSDIGMRRKAKSLGMKLSQYGLFDCEGQLVEKTERGIRKRLGLRYKRPEERG